MTTNILFLFVWVIFLVLYICAYIFFRLIRKGKLAQKRNLTAGIRTIMSMRSEQTWLYTHQKASMWAIYLVYAAVFVHFVALLFTFDFMLTSVYSIKVLMFGLGVLTVIIEIILIIKFKWNGEPRKKSS